MLSRLKQQAQHLTQPKSDFKSNSNSNMAVVFDEKTPDITLYTTQTPNGIKISIALEELGYVLHPPHKSTLHAASLPNTTITHS